MKVRSLLVVSLNPYTHAPAELSEVLLAGLGLDLDDAFPFFKL